MLSLTAWQTAVACTGIRLIAKDGSVVVARTLEFGADRSKVGVFPAGTTFVGTLPNNGTGITFKSKYGMVGANAFGLPVLVDGINDQGLYVGEFFFPGSAQFADVTPENSSRAMAGYQYSMWILANFATVAEVKAAYDRVALVSTVLPALGMAPPVHFRIMDKTGAAVVVEPIGGKLVIYDDPLGVLTNSPTFDWHMTNLSNYVGLSAENRASVTIQGVTLNSFGQGSGFYGIPAFHATVALRARRRIRTRPQNRQPLPQRRSRSSTSSTTSTYPSAPFVTSAGKDHRRVDALDLGRRLDELAVLLPNVQRSIAARRRRPQSLGERGFERPVSADGEPAADADYARIAVAGAWRAGASRALNSRRRRGSVGIASKTIRRSR